MYSAEQIVDASGIHEGDNLLRLDTEKSAQKILDELAEIIPDGNDTVGEIERREMLHAVTVFLRELPQKQQDLFVRRYWYSSDIGTLAEMFDMSEGNVKMTLSRLRKRLKKHLEKEGLL